MYLDIFYNNGHIERFMDCVAVECENKVLHVYPNYQSWITKKPIHCLNVKRYLICDGKVC